jgi:hypothetical protein
VAASRAVRKMNAFQGRGIATSLLVLETSSVPAYGEVERARRGP